MQDASLSTPVTISPPMLQLGGVFVLVVAVLDIGFLIAYHQFAFAALILTKTGLGALVFRSTRELREQHIRTSPSNEITRRVAAALQNSLVLMAFVSLLVDFFFGSFAVLLST